MIARERRREIRARAHDIAARYPRPVRVLALADEQALADLRREHTAAVTKENVANYCIRETGNNMNRIDADDMRDMLASLSNAIDAIDARVPNIARRDIARVRAKLLGAAVTSVAVEPAREVESVS